MHSSTNVYVCNFKNTFYYCIFLSCLCSDLTGWCLWMQRTLHIDLGEQFAAGPCQVVASSHDTISPSQVPETESQSQKAPCTDLAQVILNKSRQHKYTSSQICSLIVETLHMQDFAWRLSIVSIISLLTYNQTAMLCKPHINSSIGNLHTWAWLMSVNSELLVLQFSKGKMHRFTTWAVVCWSVCELHRLVEQSR